MESREVLHVLDSRAEVGLSEREAETRRAQYGSNELVESGLKSPWRILWEQLTAVMMVVLIVAAAIKGLLGEYIDAGAILAIVVLNAILGFVQEYRAEKAMAALKGMAAPLVRARRDGRIREIPGKELVPGDIVLLEAGNAVPADLRLIESANLRVQEASLTGESLPVDKTPGLLARNDVPLGDRHNMLYMGTAIAYGRGAGVVVSTGMKTELGRIATLLQEISTDETPLQRRIKHLGILLAVSALVVVAIIFGLGVLRGRDAVDMFLAGVAIAVAAIPEGLPAVLTITLALGAQRMLKRRALIRKLPAVETLGSVTVICSDKTGTLTENKMQVTVLDVAGQTVEVSAEQAESTPSPAQTLLLAAGTLCNDATLDHDEQTGALSMIGDPTEGALLIAASHRGLLRSHLEQWFPRVAEVPFSSERKRMTTFHRIERDLPARPVVDGVVALLESAANPYIAFTKGSVDGLLNVSEHIWNNGTIEPLTEAWQQRIMAGNDRLAQQGLRVLGLAYRPAEALPMEGRGEESEHGLIFIGLVGMIDPPRPEVKDAVRVAKGAGIRPIMITGDHPLTALQIARDLGIVGQDNGRVMTGQQLSALDAETLGAAVREVSVFARVSPEHKLNIVQALQEQGHVVAMTGDGVNDAPALRKSDIGVAMGITGTDVSKEAADMVITDDNFSTIVNAVEEGRTIYDNVRKFVKYIVTSNAGEVMVMFLTQLFGMPLPMTTLQILWMNLVTDGVPGLALGQEPTERDTMRRHPFSPQESIFSRGLGRHVLMIGPVLALVAFGVGYMAWLMGNPAWGTMIFVTLTLSQLGHALAVRSNRESLFTIGLRSNPLLLGAVLVTLVLQLAVVYLPPFQTLFETVPLTLSDLALCLGASTLVFWAVELEKWFLRRQDAANAA